jgi:membrane dipeptidase
MSFPIADAHNDLLLELSSRRREDAPFGTHWLDQLRAGNVRLQVCSIHTAHFRGAELHHALLQVTACFRALRENPGHVMLVRSRRDLDAVRHAERIGLVLSFEGVEPLGYEPELVDVFWELGVRITGLTWLHRNPFADGNADGGGISRLGAALIERLDALGMLIDLAHASDATFEDVLSTTTSRRLLVSHAGCRALTDIPRNLPDAHLRAIAERGGIVGIFAYPPALDPTGASIDRLVDHIDHAVSIMGIDHVALGSDFFQQVFRSGAIPLDELPPGLSLGEPLDGLAGPRDFPNLVRALEARGYTGNRLEAILSANLLNFLGGTMPDD